MTTQQPSNLAPSYEIEQTLVEYLRQHPDFFDRHAELLADLVVPHPTGGAVSLIERQVEVLRTQNQRHRKELKVLLTVARENDQLNSRIHRLTLTLLRGTGFENTCQRLHKHLREEFQVDAVRLVLIKPKERDLSVTHDCFVAADTSGLEDFDDFFASPAQPRCGRFKVSRQRFLFGEEAQQVRSTALIPLQACRDVKGLLAIGSRDETRFHPGMGTAFLAHLGELVSNTLAPYLTTNR